MMLQNKYPRFLSRLDHYLLTNYPLIWRTKIHWILFGSLVVHSLLFILFSLLPITTANLPSDEVISGFQMTVFALGCFALIIWGLKTVKVPIRSYQLSSFLLTAMIYWFGILAISSNVWMASKAIDIKIAGLVEDITLEVDRKKIRGERRQKFDKTNLSLLDIRQLGNRYQVTENFPINGPEVMPVHALVFIEDYGISFNEFTRIVYNRVETIASAKQSGNIWYVGFGYHGSYWLIIVGLMVLPLLAMGLTLGSFQQTVSLLLAHFLTLIGIAIGTSHDSSNFEAYYLLYALIMCGLAMVSKLYSRKLNLFVLYAAALIPISSLILLETGILHIFHNRNYSIPPDVLLTLLTAILSSFMCFLYHKNINQPQTS